ncbi:hypothetical protein GOBAR_AA23168 [Gossypium barbadense]|uniref:Uncharacterized protein n=1 Tax=Gossypium barbadense TaxID=3634 RepID=A0A2P5X2D6_GOSBA|nr:hypothetical protein GOBAR_AA23168 [Gossypium barbadense]
MQEIVLKNTYESCSNNNKEPIYEERRLQIEELDEWKTQKLRTPDKPKLSQDKLNTSPNQLKVGEKVLLDTADPRIATPEPNEEIPLTVQCHPHVIHLADAVRALQMTNPWGLFFEIVEPTYLEFTLELYSMFHLQTIMTNFDDPGMEFMDDNKLNTLYCHIHYSPSKCWRDLVPASATYDPSRSKASALSLSLKLLNTVAQSSSLTLISQMSPQGISSMLNMMMIEKWRGTYPPQYCLIQSTKEEDPEDITDGVPPRYENPPSQPPPPSCPVHRVASYADISECLTRFEQQCFQCFDNIDATLQ